MSGRGHRYLTLAGGVSIVAGGTSMIWPVLPPTFAVGLILLGMLVIASQARGIVADIKAFGTYVLARTRVQWRINGCGLGMVRYGSGPIYIAGFGASGINRTGGHIHELSGEVYIPKSGRSFPMFMNIGGDPIPFQ